MIKIITIAASGGFDPLHSGHIEYLNMAKNLAINSKLIVIVNTDEFLMAKKGYVFQTLKERLVIIKNLKCVDEVIACIDKDLSVIETLRMIKPDIFAKGGDRNETNIPEKEVCDKLGIKIVSGLGSKIQSSSELVNNVQKSQKAPI